jgi:hypothetical protein
MALDFDLAAAARLIASERAAAEDLGQAAGDESARHRVRQVRW